MFSNQWGVSRFYAILVTKNWSSSVPEPKWIFKDPDHANNYGSERNRIHNTGVGYTAESRDCFVVALCDVAYKTKSRLPGVGYTTELRLRGVGYTAESFVKTMKVYHIS